MGFFSLVHMNIVPPDDETEQFIPPSLEEVVLNGEEIISANSLDELQKKSFSISNELKNKQGIFVVCDLELKSETSFTSLQKKLFQTPIKKFRMGMIGLINPKIYQ